jgi:hypothetical protein
VTPVSVPSAPSEGPAPAGPSDGDLLPGVRAADPAAVAAWARRDHPIAELLCAAATAGDPAHAGAPAQAQAAAHADAPARAGAAGDGGPLYAGWRAALAAVATQTPAGGMRATLLAEVLNALDDAGLLDTSAPPPVSVPDPYLPAGDPWEGWWSDESASRPLPARPQRDDVVRALRGLALVPRVLLVLRDGAGLPPGAVTGVTGATEEQQGTLLGSARPGFVHLLDAATADRAGRSGVEGDAR